MAASTSSSALGTSAGQGRSSMAAAAPPAVSSNGGAGTTRPNQLYALASRVPLIKSPSISLPPRAKLPADLHPLPPDIAAYFVYPFSLESYVLDPNTPSSATIDQLLDKHKLYLEQREQHKLQRHREMLHKMAPGWQGAGASVLQPTTKNEQHATATDKQEQSKQGDQKQDRTQDRTPLDDLADHLAQLDALHSQSNPTPGHTAP